MLLSLVEPMLAQDAEAIPPARLPAPRWPMSSSTGTAPRCSPRPCRAAGADPVVVRSRLLCVIL